MRQMRFVMHLLCFSLNQDDQSDDRNKHDASSLEFSEKTKKRPLEDPSWWEDDTPSAKKAKLYHSAPSTPMVWTDFLKHAPRAVTHIFRDTGNN